MSNRWFDDQNPKPLTIPAHGNSVVTCLILSHGRIIAGSDDHSIHVYSPDTGELIRSLDGHEGGVWAIAATKRLLVSGSTDRTTRIWDLETGRNTHVFGDHTSTVRSLVIVKPEWIDVEQADGTVVREQWPKRPLIVTGSRDHTVRVWDLPLAGDPEYIDPDASSETSSTDNANPYLRHLLEGHDHAIRSIAGQGKIAVSASYDYTLRVWDITTGECRWTLIGHREKVYNVAIDIHRKLACSGSLDGTVRLWDIEAGTCKHVLTGHTSLVGKLALSPSYLVSGAADSTLRVWDPITGQLYHVLSAHSGAITCFCHDETKVLSGSDGALKIWNIKDGTQIRDLLTGIVGVWQVVFDGRWCVAASSRANATFLSVWDFGDEEAGVHGTNNAHGDETDDGF